jgi:flagellin-specific chaperone FliS
MERNRGQETLLTENEKKQLNDVFKIINKLKIYLNENNLDQPAKIKDIYKYIIGIKNIQGNFSNSISFISCLLAKNYLINNHNIKDIDVGLKPQSANGLDINEITEDGKKIIAEIKTIYPYGNKDFGAAQKDGFRKDFEKLNNTRADYKYLFVTEERTFEILNMKYKNELKDVKIILL